MITLVIPTFDRPDYLDRLLRYYAGLKFAHPILVADSSNAEARDRNHRRVLEWRAGLDVTYIEYPSDTDIFLKLVDAIGRAGTALAVLCADDDFVVPGGIEQCATFLMEHEDYSIAHGHAFAVTVHSSREPDCVRYEQRSIEFAASVDRLRVHLANYCPTFYSVHRRDQMIGNLDLASRIAAPKGQKVYFEFGELLPSCLSVIQGKSKCLDTLYMVRQDHPNRTSAAATAPLILADSFSTGYASFREALVHELCSIAGMTAEDARASAERAFMAHFIARLRVPPTKTETALLRLARGLDVLPALLRSAASKGAFLETLTAPVTTYRRLRRERDVSAMPSTADDGTLKSLLDPKSPFSRDFAAVYRHVAGAAS